MLQRKILAVAIASCFAGGVNALPVAPTVATGAAVFSQTGKNLTVTNSPGAIINWQGFSIAQGEATRFIQQSAASAVLNRVTGGDPSSILGQLQSNGRVFLINPNGITFGAGAQIDVAGLVASSLHLSDADFINGRFKFGGNESAGQVINRGEIRTPEGGKVWLIAPKVENSGLITTPTLAANSNYNVTGYTGANLSIGARNITLTADAQSKTYGNNDPTLTYVVGGSGLANNAGIGVVDTQAGVFSGTQTRAAGETVLGGPYVVSGSGLANNAGIGVVDTQGGVFSGAQTRAAGETVAGGPYAITQGTLAANSNYNVTGYTGANLSIAARNITLTADAQSKTYGNNDPTSTYVVGGSGLANNAGIGVVDTQAGVFSGTQTRAAGETVLGGPYAITQGTLSANSNYNVTGYTGNNLSIAARNITLSADAQTKTYGNNDPTLTYVVGGSGLANNAGVGVVDTQAGVFSGAQTRAAGETVLGGPYAITQGTLAANSNYNVTGYTGANLSIGARNITVTADAQSKIYGNNDPTLTFVVGQSGLANNAAIGVVDTQATVFTGAQARTAGEAVLDGPYAISQGTLLAVNSNYNLAGYTGANLTISPALLTITAEDKTRFFGQANPLFTAIYSGLKLADKPTSVGAGLQFSTPANPSSTIGNYPITPFGLGSGNYTISYFSGNLRIDAGVPPAINIVPGGLVGLSGGLTQAPLFVASVNLSSSFGGINSLPAPAAGPASAGDANSASSEDSAGAPGSSNNTRAAPSSIESVSDVMGESQPRLFEPGMSCSPASPMQAFSCR